MAASVPDGIRVVGFMLVLSVGPLDKKVIAMTWIVWQTKCIVAVKTLCVKLLLDSATAIGAGLGKGSRLPVGTEHPVPWGLSCSAPGLPWDVFAIFPKHHPMSAKTKKEKKKKVKAETDQAHGLHQAKGQPVGLSGSLVAPCCARAGWAHRSARPQTRSRGAASGAGEGRAITLLFYWQERGVPLVLHQSAGHCLPQGPARLCSHWQASADSEVTRAGESLSRAEGSSSSTTMCYQPAECRARDWQPY